MTLLPLMEWLAGTRWSIALHESLYMYPLVESTHVLAITVFVGLATVSAIAMIALIATLSAYFAQGNDQLARIIERAS